MTAEPTCIWMDGELVPWAQANVHVMTHGLHYGTAVFEGIRAYETERGTALFRAPDHLRRLLDSARLYSMPCPYDEQELLGAVRAVTAANELGDGYVRPLVYRGLGQLSPNPSRNPVQVAIAALALPVPVATQREGVRAHVSSWRRLHRCAFAPAAKASGHYLNSALALAEAEQAGCELAVMLNDDGTLSEGATENLAIVRDNVLISPHPAEANALDGVTLRTVIELARREGLSVVRRTVHRSDLDLADEVFATGTAAEIVPVREIGGRALEAPGPVTRVLQGTFQAVVRGRTAAYAKWLDVVGAPEREVAA